MTPFFGPQKISTPNTAQTPDPFTRDHLTWTSSYSGTDTQIYAVVDVSDFEASSNDGRTPIFRPIAELQTLSISSARNVYPVRRLGESHVTEYTRGARTIAGSMVFATGLNDFFAYMSARSKKERKAGSPYFMDEFPSFAILITCANEYGQASHSALTDVTLTNWGTTHSESDMYLESTYTYVARYYHPHLADAITPPKIEGSETNKLSNTSGVKAGINEMISRVKANPKLMSDGTFSPAEIQMILTFYE